MRLKTAIVGNGEIVKYIYLPIIKGHRELELTAICARDQGRLLSTALEFGVPHRYHDWRQMLDEQEIDLLVVATPNALHYEISSEALRRGCLLVVEKPAVIKARHGRELLALARQRQRAVIINTSLRFLPAIKLLREICRSRLRVEEAGFEFEYHISRPQQDWYFDVRLAGGGVVYCIGIHAVDLIPHLIGGQVKEVQVRESMPDRGSTVEESALLAVELADGRSGLCNLSWTRPSFTLCLKIYDSRRHVLLRMGNGDQWTIESEGALLARGKLWHDFVGHNVIQYLLDHVRSGEDPALDLSLHLSALEPLLRGYEASRAPGVTIEAAGG